ncbi:hypothetical protein [Paludisphaera mucosa]|uniref:Uncharacterized protein n=1 Tax=Paludisphaera mucosa TaxID=3030827 RepID=A0ABT6FA93_9BACT|nr:hypothetical protein [Paludisphaera mucosa]MDG3004442.1 hypothetical protein [Paludisphaera mucosa]
MSETSTDPEPQKDDEHAAAEWLFQDDPGTAKGPQPTVVAPGGESFDLADSDTPVPAPRGVAPPPSSEWEMAAESAYAAKAEARAKPAGKPEPAGRERPAARRLDAAPAVDHAWSRGAEWGPTIVAMIAWAAAAWFAIYVCIASEMYAAALAAFAIGTVVGLALFYPIIITLERPIRMTPEQALRDYFYALSHHFPHYKRMWLLLSNAGRTTSKFASYEGFKRYWKAKLKQLRVGRVKGSAPLVFVPAEFKSEKSGGKATIDATWTIRVFVRGRREQGPIWSFPMEGTFAKGPDNMWYLDEGTLAERAARPAVDAG